MLSTKEHIQNIEKKLFSRFSFEAVGDNKIKKTKKQKPHFFTDKRLVALKNQLKSLPSKISFLNIRGFSKSLILHRCEDLKRALGVYTGHSWVARVEKWK